MTRKGANNSYWGNIKDAVSSLFNGLAVTLRHIWEAKDSRTPIGIEDNNYFNQKTGIVTLQYPNESFPVPDNGRYRLHNEIEDCIVCDKCAKICPVNCIDIEPVRAIDEALGKTSDGTPKRIHAAKFDIDMGKCCFCGLCTTVCPTECLTMTKAYDFSEFDVADHIYEFAEMTPLEILEKKQKLELYNQEKANALAAKKLPNQENETANSVAKPKPTFKPKVQAPTKKQGEVEQKDASASPSPKPVFRPKMKPLLDKEESGVKEEKGDAKVSSAASPKPVFKPRVKPVKSDDGNEEKAPLEDNGEKSLATDKPKPVFRPKIKPVIPKNETTSETKEENAVEKKDDEDVASSTAKPRLVFKPKIKPTVEKEDDVGAKEDNKTDEAKETTNSKPRPVFRPKIKPKKDDDSTT